MSKIRIIRSKKHYEYHVISSSDVLKHGMEKACILGNLDKVSEIYDRSEWHKGFAYIKKNRFEVILKELIKDGLIEIKKESNHE